MPYEEVTILESPITPRYVTPGAIGLIDHEKEQIRVGGAWFAYDTKRWKVISTDLNVKKKAALEELGAKSFIPDRNIRGHL